MKFKFGKVNMEKLTGISETLLVTLYFRYLETLRSDRMVQDMQSVDIIQQITDVDWSKFSRDQISQLMVAIRTKIIDDATRNFLKTHPSANIINLAAGLCTRFFRIDNGDLGWYNIDLEPVKQLWMQLIGESDRHRFIVGSAFNFEWSRYLPNHQSQKYLLIMEGLSMYLNTEMMHQLIIDIQTHFPQSEFILDVISESALNFDNPNSAVAQTSAKFSWGINNLQDIETWGANIHLAQEWDYTDYNLERWHEINIQDLSPYQNISKVGHFLIA